MKANPLTPGLLVLALLSSTAWATTYYVDFAGGSDAAAGTSPAAAWQHCPGDANATGTPASTTLVGGDTVIFKGAVHYRGKISISASGTSGNPIVFDGNTAGTFGTGRAVIDGSQQLTGWTACTSSTDGGNNPNWQHIYKIALPAGVSLFTANLYEGDTLLAMAQDPNVSDAMSYDDLSTYNSVPPSAVTDTDTEVTITDSTYFTQTSSSYWNGGFVHVWHNPNAVSTLAVTGFNTSTDTIITAPLGGGNIYTDRNTLYAMANCLPILDTPGEYVINETTDMIYLWPLCEADPDTTVVTTSVRECGIDVGSRDYIIIQGFKVMRHAAGFGAYHSGVGIRSRLGTTGLTIANNEVAQNSSMEGYGAIYVASGVDVIAEDNDVHDNAHGRGIFFSSVTNGVIRDNTVRRNGGTGIGLYGVVGGEVRGNLVLEQNSVHANGITLYLECDGVEVVGNTVRDGNVALTTQDANNLTIAYNVFQTDIDGYTVADWNSSTRPSYNLHYYNNVMMNNYSKALSVGTYGRDGLIVRNNIIDGAGIGCGDNISHNIYTSLMWNQKSQYGWSLGTGEIIEMDKSLVFVNDAEYDYHLVTDSPGIDAGTSVGYSEDIEGTAVPYNSVVDIGAYEYVPAIPNQPPVANAGNDQTVTDTDDNGSQSVTLNGSSSYDPDGTIVSYVWKEGANQVATGAQTSAVLSVGQHTITLTVTDDDSATGSDSLIAYVQADGDAISQYAWQNFSVATQAGTCTWTFDATPNRNNMDGLTALSLGTVDAWGDCAVTTRFNSSGYIDSYDYNVYAADASVPYTAGTEYHFRVVVNIPAHTYSVYVTPEGQSEVTLATDYAFRLAAGSPSSLNNWACKGEVGTHSISNVSISGGATLTVVQTPGDCYTITAHDGAVNYWEAKVDIQSGAVYSFKDLTDAGNGQGGHTSYLSTDGYTRRCSLIYFDGRGGNVLTRSNSLDDLADHLTFTTAPDGSSFTITYTEDATTTDWFHDSYSSGSLTLYPGDLETTIELVITPPDENGTAWDWTIISENVSAHGLSLKVWAEEYVSAYLYDSIVKTYDSDTTRADGAWYDPDPESYLRWTIGSNPTLGLTSGREFIVDRQSALAGYSAGGTIATSTWAGFAHARYKSAFDYSGSLASGNSRVTTGQVLINITAP
ncbi:MAG: hypothetical protein GX591_00560 [Planctomycetes bacterium]|nr:hypothetical protein [Planctomycetota bacterium]